MTRSDPVVITAVTIIVLMDLIAWAGAVYGITRVAG